MPHDAHFLERLDRVTREQTEFALGLYRDHEAVKYVLEHVSMAPDAERVALSIDDGRRGPFVIVSRDGHFVTCLGEGMSPGAWPVVPRGRLDALLAKVADRRARREMAAREMRPDEEEGDLFVRLASRGSRLTREDFVAVSAFEGMLGTQPYGVMLQIAVDVLRERPGASNVRRVHGGLEKAVKRHDRMTWLIAHLTVLAGVGERRELDELVRVASRGGGSPTTSCSEQAGLTFLLRSAWLAARMGKGVLPAYATALEQASSWITVSEAALAIGAIGLRHASAFGDARRLLAAQTPIAEKSTKDPVSLARAAYGQWVGHVMDSAESHTTNCIKAGQEMALVYGKRLPDGHPLRFAAIEEVPEDLARTAVLQYDGDVYDEAMMTLSLGALPIAARARAEDFFFPREVVRAWLGTWGPDETLFRLERFYKHNPKKVPVTAARTPGRNEPCTCGSGKKWKRCCGERDPGASPSE